MAEDFLHAARERNPSRDFDTAIYHQALKVLSTILAAGSNKSLSDFELPEPTEAPAAEAVADEIAKYDPAAQADQRDTIVGMLNEQQRAGCTAIMVAINTPPMDLQTNAFFVDGVGA